MSTDTEPTGLFTGMPLWVRGIVVFGFPTMLSIFLVWWLTSGMEMLLMETHKSTLRHSAEAADDHARLEALIQALTRTNRQICVNTAKTESQQAACVRE